MYKTKFFQRFLLTLYGDICPSKSDVAHNLQQNILHCARWTCNLDNGYLHPKWIALEIDDGAKSTEIIQWFVMDRYINHWLKPAAMTLVFFPELLFDYLAHIHFQRLSLSLSLASIHLFVETIHFRLTQHKPLLKGHFYHFPSSFSLVHWQNNPPKKNKSISFIYVWSRIFPCTTKRKCVTEIAY